MRGSVSPMTHPKRPRDPNQLAKSIIDIRRAANAPHGLFPSLGSPPVSPARVRCGLLGCSAAALAPACNARPAETWRSQGSKGGVG
jgi:hypothetical protein